MANWWQRLKKGLEKTSSQVSRALTFTRLDDETLEELEETLILSDMGVERAMTLRALLEKKKVQTAEEAKQVLFDELVERVEPVAKPLVVDADKKPFVILMVGVNGAGKTTTIGKLAGQMKDKGLKVAFGAVDTFRMAAIEQLQAWGQRTGCAVYAKEQGADPAGTAYDALQAAKKNGDDVLFLDTAGRLQNKKELMEELRKIIRVIQKIDASAPHGVLLTLDATVGQNALSQVAAFNDITDVTGLVMTKLDGTAKGGILIALADRFQIPIHYVGVGEGKEDLNDFTARDYVSGLLGMDNE